MFDNELVSVIIPVYNTEVYLKECLDSVVNQTYKNIEIIIVNDGSPDNSSHIIEQYARKDCRIIVINQQNQGLSIARNNAIKKAKGVYLSFVDSDDTIHTHMIEELVDMIKKTKSDIAICKHNRIRQDGQNHHVPFPKITNSHFEDILNPSSSVSVCNKLFKKQLFIDNEIWFPKGYTYEDNITTIKLFYYAQKVCYVDKALYNYHIRKNSITTKLVKKNIDDIFKIGDDLSDFLSQHNILKKYKFYCLLRVLTPLYNRVLPYLVNNQDKELLEYLFDTIKKSNYFSLLYLKQIHKKFPDFYVKTLVNIILIDDKHKLEKDFPENHYKKVATLLQNSIEDIFLQYLIEQNIKEIIIYGTGEIFTKLFPLLKKHNIKVVAVLDKDIEVYKKLNLDIEFLHKQDLLQTKYQIPILIASVAFAQEIYDEIKSYSTNIINIHTILELF